MGRKAILFLSVFAALIILMLMPEKVYACFDNDDCPDYQEATCYGKSGYCGADRKCKYTWECTELCEAWDPWRECRDGYTTRYCTGHPDYYQIAQCDASGNPIDEGGGGASCQPSDGDCMQIGPDGNYLYLGYDYQANSIVYNGSVRCVCRIWLADHYLCYQEHCVPNYNGTAANWVSTGENCPCPADSCGVCSVACGGGMETCSDGYSSWEESCNWQSCQCSLNFSLDFSPFAKKVNRALVNA